MNISDLKQNALVQTKRRELLKVSTIYSETSVSATVLLNQYGDAPERTTVRFYGPDDVATWKSASTQLIRDMEYEWFGTV